MLAAFDIGDHVCAFHVGQCLRRQHQFHFYRALLHKIDNHLRVLRSDCAPRDLRRIVRVSRLTSMRDSIIRAANRSNQTRARTEPRCRDRTSPTVKNSLFIRCAAAAFGGHLFIEGIIEQNNFARDFFARQRFQLIQISYGDHVLGNSIRRRRDASAKCAQNNLLRRVLRLTWPLNQLRVFFAADPVRHQYFLQLHFAADRFQFACDVLNRFSRLRRSAQPRPDVVRQMRDLPKRIIAVQRRLLQPFQISQRLRRKNNRRRARCRSRTGD